MLPKSHSKRRAEFEERAERSAVPDGTDALKNAIPSTKVLGYFRDVPDGDRHAYLSDDVSSDLSSEASAKEEALAKGEAPRVPDDGRSRTRPTPNAERQTPNAKRQTPNAKRFAIYQKNRPACYLFRSSLRISIIARDRLGKANPVDRKLTEQIGSDSPNPFPVPPARCSLSLILAAFRRWQCNCRLPTSFRGFRYPTRRHLVRES